MICLIKNVKALINSLSKTGSKNSCLNLLIVVISWFFEVEMLLSERRLLLKLEVGKNVVFMPRNLEPKLAAVSYYPHHYLNVTSLKVISL